MKIKPINELNNISGVLAELENVKNLLNMKAPKLENPVKLQSRQEFLLE